MRYGNFTSPTKFNSKPRSSIQRNRQFILLSLGPLYFLIIGLILEPPQVMLQGLFKILTEPDYLITDYFALGGPSATFVNASLVTLLCILIMYVIGMKVDGVSIAALGLMLGFAMFGKNLVNIWPIILGVAIYARFHKDSLSKYFYIGIYSTSLAPIVTHAGLLPGFSLPVRLLFGLAVGIIIGIAMPPLCAHLYNTHRGYSLYNGGFAAGITATVIFTVFKSMGYAPETRLFWDTGRTLLSAYVILPFFGLLIIAGFINDKLCVKKYLNIQKYPGLGGTDYTFNEGFPASLMNMGVNGIFTTCYLLILGAPLNGASIGGILTIVGFSAAGKNLRNIFPVMTGIVLASLVGTWHITDPAAVLALCFCTTIAPIAGQFGLLIGLLAGFLHAAVVLNIGAVYSGMNLYNNGFAGGIVASFLVPILTAFANRNARRRGFMK